MNKRRRYLAKRRRAAYRLGFNVLCVSRQMRLGHLLPRRHDDPREIALRDFLRAVVAAEREKWSDTPIAHQPH